MTRLASLVLLAALACVDRSADAQNVAIPLDTKITLERTTCFGTCAAYTVSIDSAGRVVFEGKANVRVPGRHSDRIPRSQVARILLTVERIGFFELKDQYRVDITTSRPRS